MPAALLFVLSSNVIEKSNSFEKLTYMLDNSFHPCSSVYVQTVYIT